MGAVIWCGGLCRILPGGVAGRVSFRPWAYSKIWHAAVPLGAPRPYPFAVAVFPGRPLTVGFGGHALPLALDIFYGCARRSARSFSFCRRSVSLPQMWLCASSLSSKFNPYALYSISNFGSFAALLSYPFVLKCIGIFHGRFGSGGPFIFDAGVKYLDVPTDKNNGNRGFRSSGPGRGHNIFATNTVAAFRGRGCHHISCRYQYHHRRDRPGAAFMGHSPWIVFTIFCS